MPYLFPFCIGAIFMFVTLWLINHSPFGYEDATGYHAGLDQPLPCPHCGELPIIDYRGLGNHAVYHKCEAAESYTELLGYYDKFDAIKRWNELWNFPANKPGDAGSILNASRHGRDSRESFKSN